MYGSETVIIQLQCPMILTLQRAISRKHVLYIVHVRYTLFMVSRFVNLYCIEKLHKQMINAKFLFHYVNFHHHENLITIHVHVYNLPVHIVYSL